MCRSHVALLVCILVTAPALAPAVEPAVVGGGDCNDIDPNVHPDQPEIPGNRIDDDCDGLADEPSADMADADVDGITIAAGDCNDVNPNVRPSAAEVQGNLIDDDCDGLADEDAGDNPSTDILDHDDDGFTIANNLIFYCGFEA